MFMKFWQHLSIQTIKLIPIGMITWQLKHIN